MKKSTKINDIKDLIIRKFHVDKGNGLFLFNDKYFNHVQMYSKEIYFDIAAKSTKSFSLVIS